jgi:hypothetical protein
LGDYETAFGLLDNPFSPQTFAGVDPYLLGDLPDYALRLDEEPGLEALFVCRAGPFERALDRFEVFLEGGRYKNGDPQALLRSKVFRLIGPEGSGKSTLTNMLVRKIKDCGHHLEPVRVTIEDGAIDQAIDAIRRQGGGREDGILCLILDNVSYRDERQLHRLHQELRQKTGRPVVMIENCHSAQDIGVPPPRPAAPTEVETMRTDWLSPEHAVAFVTARIAVFRSPTAVLPDSLQSFPFNIREIAALFAASRDGEVVEEGAMTLRTFSRVLMEALDWERREHGDKPIAGAVAAELETRCINLKVAYARYIDDLAGAFA